MNFFDFKNTIGRSPFLTREIFYPPEGEHFIAPQVVPIWDLSVLYLHRELFFGFQITPCNRPFLTREIFYPPEVGATVMLPYGVPFESLSLLYLTLSDVFSTSIYTRYLLIFDPWNFLSPVAGPSLVPYGVPIWFSFCLISSPKKSFLDFNLPQDPFIFDPRIFLI